jgi:DNA-binding XRE family transcriptional regulator
MWYIVRPINQGYVRQREITANTTRKVREQLGVTQTALAAMLRVSPKAIQSYEQGWRKLPWHLLSQMLVLLALQRGRDRGRPACWEQTGCSRRGKADCPSTSIGGGRYCWLAAGANCVQAGPEGKAVPCETCAVIARLLRGTAAAAPVGRAPRSALGASPASSCPSKAPVARAPRIKASLSGQSQSKRQFAKKAR